jgi:hypothetical protein
LKEKASDLIALLSAVDAGVLAPMISVAGEDVKAMMQADAALATEIEDGVEKGSKEGFGIAALSTGSGVVCEVVGDDRDAHQALLEPYRRRLGEELRMTPTFVVTSADEAFVSAKRGQCGAIYANASDLKKLIEALRRDQIAFRYLPIWFGPDQVAGAREALAGPKRREQEKEAEARRQKEDKERQAELDAARARKQGLMAKVEAGKVFAKGALAMVLPRDIQASLRQFLEHAGSAGDASEPALAQLISELDGLRPAAENAVVIAKATTPKNSFVIEGALDDVLVLYNDTGKAPSIVKNLRGDLVFESNKTSACQAGGGLTDLWESRALNARLEKWQQALALPLTRCNMKSLTAYDLVIFSRGDLLKEKASDLIALLSAVDAGVLAPMISVSGEDVKAMMQGEAVLATEIEDGVAKGLKEGFGVVALSTGSSVVCEVVGDDRDAHRALLEPYRRRLGEELRMTPTFVVTSADGAFVSAKRGQCGAIYANASDLKKLIEALRRDQIAFRYLPIWFGPDQVAGAREALSGQKRREQEKEADARRQKEDEERLRRQREGDEAAARGEKQAELQKQYGAMARAFEGQLATDMKDLLEHGSPQVAAKYPPVSTWLAAQLRDHWELMTFETTLMDYGVAEFNGRSLEAGFARTTIKMRNRLLGKYQEGCFVTAFVDDKEFAMAREPFSAPCETASGVMTAYRQGERFASRWLVQ